jgi:hypothetical protein
MNTMTLASQVRRNSRSEADDDRQEHEQVVERDERHDVAAIDGSGQ